MVYSIDMEKKSGREQKECIFWIMLRAMTYLIYNYFMYFMEEKKKIYEIPEKA